MFERVEKLRPCVVAFARAERVERVSFYHLRKERGVRPAYNGEYIALHLFNNLVGGDIVFVLACLSAEGGDVGLKAVNLLLQVSICEDAYVGCVSAFFCERR